MTWEERVRAVQHVGGFTERQAGFLVTVMLFAGVCLGRHYCTFARIAYGQKMHDFFTSLVAHGFATVHASGHNRARIFHVHYKPLYRAIGEPDNRHRRPVALGRAVERLMVLDTVLAEADRAWLATEQEKLQHFTITMGVPQPDLPRLVFRAEDRETPRFFPDKLPIAVDAGGRSHTFVYVLTRELPVDFRAFLERHAELWRTLRQWTLRLVVPRPLTWCVSTYEAAFHEQVASPLHPQMLADLRWYFHARQRRSTDSQERLEQAARAFRAPRFQALYRAWLERGESVLDATQSAVLADALTWGNGGFETYVLPHSYARLLPLVGTA